MKLWSPEAWRPRSAGGAPEPCRRGGIVVWRSRGLEVWRRAVGITMWRFGGLGVRCRRAEVDAVEIWSSGGMLWAWGRGRTWRCLSQELRSSEGALQACRRGDSGGIERWKRAEGIRRDQALDARWRYVDASSCGCIERWERAEGMRRYMVLG